MAEGGVTLEKDKFLEDDAKFPCLICGQRGLTQNEMRVHIMMEHVERDISCPFCDLSGITSSEMNLHINSTHLVEDDTAQTSQSNTLSVKHNDSPDAGKIEVHGTKSLEIHSNSMDKMTTTSENAPARNSQRIKSTDSEDDNKVSSDTTSSQTLKMAGNLHSDHDESCSSKTENKLNKSIDKLKNVQSSDGVDKSHLFLDVSPPSEEVGVLRMTRGFNSSLNQGLASGPGHSRGASQRSDPLAVPDINDNVELDINSNIPGEFSCPMCQFSTISETDIQTHVNREHLDILSPCKGGDFEMVDDNSVPRCPLCGEVMSSIDELQIHVNTSHSDILSPDQPMEMQGKSYPPMSKEVEKPTREKKASTLPLATFDKNDNDEDWEMGACGRTWNGEGGWQDVVVCPVCDQEFDDAAILEIHVNGHFSADNTPGNYDNIMT